MNSIASPRRTEIGAEFWTRERVATALATALFTMLIVSFRPFQPAGAVLAAGSGDSVNQLGFGALGAAAIFGLAGFARPARVAALFGPTFLLMLGFFAISIGNATDPSAATRAGMFTVIGILGVSAVLLLPVDADAFSRVLLVSGAVVLALCYAGVVLLPDVAKHTTDSVEPEHAGLWRGLFSHKNVAGPVMAHYAFAGFYLFRRGWKRAGALLFLAALVFVANTGSKTTAGLVPLAVLIVSLPGLIGLRGLTPVLVAAAILGTGLATLGIVFVPPLRDYAALHFPDLTYTGRTALWSFGGDMIAQRPWFGYGFESFWSTPVVQNTEIPFDIAWDVRGIVHGHNGYVDIAIAMGLPALGVAVVALVLAPLRDYARTPLTRENVRLADFFLMVLLFSTLNAFLESFFFRRADPVWLFFVMSVLGLRQTARFPVPPGAVPSEERTG